MSTSPNPSALEPAKRNPPIVLAMASAVLLWAAFPPAEWSGLAWFALVPFLTLVRSRRSPRTLYLAAWAGGMVFWLLAIQWVRLSDESAWLGWIVMALALSVFWPVSLALTRLAVLRLGLPLMLAGPIVWIAGEYARAYYFTGFPWYYVAHTQSRFIPIIQIADLTGSLGVSLLIVLVNTWIVDLISLPLLKSTPDGLRVTLDQRLRLGVVVVLLGTSLLYGAFRLRAADFREGPRVALIQSNLVQGLKMSESHEKLLELYASYVEKAASAEPRPDLIVWPETAYPYGYVNINENLGSEELQSQLQYVHDGSISTSQWLEKRDSIITHLHTWTDHLRIAMLVGTLFYDHQPGSYDKYNSAVLFEPGVASVQSFHKYHLVPFGEYVPLLQALPWLTILTPYPEGYVPSLSFGKEPTVLRLGRYRIATAICFEDTVPQVVRRFFGSVRNGEQPDLVVNLSNDGWFHGSSEHEMHLAASVFRAIEHRVPLARSANTGISAIVDGNGRVRQSLGTLKEGIVTGAIPLDDRTGLYSIVGDWLGLSCLAVTIGLWPLARFGTRLRRANPTALATPA